MLQLGVEQLWHSVNEGYYEESTLGYHKERGNDVLEWMRMRGDLVYILGGVLLFFWITW